jgi:uncharacterized membrane protein HdeD (DUF308 family)
MDAEILKPKWGWMLTLGILNILLGTLAIVMPWVATLAIQILLGWILIIGGALYVIHSFFTGQWGKFFLQFLIGLLYLGVGYIFLADPLKGLFTLTFLLIAYLIAEGVFRIIWALQIKPLPTWGWSLFGGIVTLLLAALIWKGWPSTAVWAIGLLVGINILFNGWAMVMLALAARKA